MSRFFASLFNKIGHGKLMKFFSCFRCESVFISNKTTGVSSSNSKLKIVKGFEELKRNPVNSM